MKRNISDVATQDEQQGMWCGFGICATSIFIGILSITTSISTRRINVLEGSPLTHIDQVMIMKISTNYLFNQIVMVYVINLGLFIN